MTDSHDIQINRMEFFLVLFGMFLLGLFVAFIISTHDLNTAQDEIASLIEIRNTDTKKIQRYERIIADMMQGQWTPDMGIEKEFVEDWYGTEIWSFKAVNRPPGSLKLNVGEVIDRKLRED